jgi:ABC-type multidrug transport system fused ATPase/permease subunit
MSNRFCVNCRSLTPFDRDISLTYPSSQTSKAALNHVSCTIKAGQLIVVVGENGSGKTSMIRILSSLRKPTAGSLLLDGVPSTEYRLSDVRRATALLSQDHSMFGLSVSENIAIGRPDESFSQYAIEEAARQGGAHEFISKFEGGYETVLGQSWTKSYAGLSSNHPLKKMYDKLEKSTQVSGEFDCVCLRHIPQCVLGGERQRLVAARTFMRISDKNVRLVIVDEPSAAMDPAGEYELFKNLRDAQDGRTMIFITHRFGHLTKHADAILYVCFRSLCTGWILTDIILGA